MILYYVGLCLLILIVVGLTVWVGSKLDKEIQELLNSGPYHDEHENFPGS